jgi:hypothetical protein
MNKLKGGRADGKSPKDFDPKQLAAGVKVEKEHTSDTKVAMEIAMDHLTEDANYYKKLKTIEKAMDPAAEASAKKDKIKNIVRRLKRKKKQALGQVSITGVTKPQKRAKGKVKEAKKQKQEKPKKLRGPKKQVMVGPKGGQYIQTSSGKRKYAGKVKKSLEHFIESETKINEFIKNFRSNNGQ